MNDTLLTLLKKVDTPTVCNAIEVAQGKRGFNAFTRGTMLASDPGAPAMVGVLSQSSASDGLQRFVERSYPASAANC